MTACVVIVAVAAITLLSVFTVRRNEQRKSDQLLLLLCETGEKNLDYYFNSVQKSVGRVASFVESDLVGVSDEELAEHMERANKYFAEMASKTNGVLTYYYRVDPEISSTVKGFWYVDLDGEGFVRHAVTDITLYDTSDTSALVWFTVPKYEGHSVWLPPYITDNLDKRVISYNVPIYWRGQFIGVVGIEIDYSTMAEQVDSIRLYSNGYAFLSDSEGNLFYHPRIDLSRLTKETLPKVPEGVKSESTFISYTFENTQKVAAWLPLSNGMRITVSAPVSEAEGNWKELVMNISVLAVGVLLVAITFTMFYTKRMVRPITELTAAAGDIENGNYNLALKLDYSGDDEVGRLTKTFKQLAVHTKENISRLNRQVFIDALTHIKNQGAFTVAMNEIQREIDEGSDTVEFAVIIFDCDNLKEINDTSGHDKGNVYLQTASKTICNTFRHSPVFRVGGDEFAVILRDESYLNIDSLLSQFEWEVKNTNSNFKNKWEQIHISMGVSRYESGSDHNAYDVVRRADKNMYDNKRKRKNARCAVKESNNVE